MMATNLFLRRVLALDALSCAGMGLATAAAASPLAPLLGLPDQVVRGAGLLLLPIAAFIGWLASRTAPSRILVLAVIIGNLGWAVESFILLGRYAETTTAIGTAFVSAQALCVLTLAILEYAGLHRLGAPA
jgi:hypothetical protein